jgi:glycosyltransferase involved in cell wall biosynthesis
MSVATHRSTSLVIATYNRGEKILETIKTTVSQSLPFTEIIVVDECSSDNTAQQIEAAYPSVRVVRTPENLFTSGARNFGARQANGEWLMFLDHDDLLLPEAHEVLSTLLDVYPRARAAFADHTYENRVSGEYFPNHHSAQISFHRLRKIEALESCEIGRLYDNRMFAALLDGNLLQQPWMIQKEAFLACGGFSADVRYCEDWDLYLRVAASVRIALTDVVIARHIVEGENLHLSDGQELMHMRVLRRVMTSDGTSWRAKSRCRMRLANYSKSFGDRAAANGSMGAAIRHYWRSLAVWPFDYMVIYRSIYWPLRHWTDSRHWGRNAS